MTCLETLVDFRGKINAMHLGKSPWIEPGLEEQCILIDWGALFYALFGVRRIAHTSFQTRGRRSSRGQSSAGFRVRFGRFVNGLGNELCEHADRVAWDVVGWYQPVHHFGMD